MFELETIFGWNEERKNTIDRTQVQVWMNHEAEGILNV